MTFAIGATTFGSLLMLLASGVVVYASPVPSFDITYSAVALVSCAGSIVSLASMGVNLAILSLMLSEKKFAAKYDLETPKEKNTHIETNSGCCCCKKKDEPKTDIVEAEEEDSDYEEDSDEESEEEEEEEKELKEVKLKQQIDFERVD